MREFTRNEDRNESASSLKLDLSDQTEADLGRCAGRIGRLLTLPAVAANSDVESSLDDFLGAIYALIQAKQNKFRDRPNRSINIKPVVQRACRMAAGSIKTDGVWVAGFYFNDALFRTAAVYHRILKVVTGRDGYVPALQLEALGRYGGWNSIRLYKVHCQVNELKHAPQGVYHGRLVTYEDALTAACDLLDLTEAWANAMTPTPIP